MSKPFAGSQASSLTAVGDGFFCFQGYELIFYGDSITETWTGTDMGRECPRCAGVPEVLEKHFGMYEKGIYAVGGDGSGVVAYAHCILNSALAHPDTHASLDCHFRGFAER